MFARNSTHQVSKTFHEKNFRSENLRHVSTLSNHAPYRTRDSFDRATQNVFQPLYEGTRLLKTAEELQSEAWRIYDSTLAADDNRFREFPYAITYTGLDRHLLKNLAAYPCFNKNETLLSLYQSGWVYIPEVKHTWSLNSTWVLGQIHKGRHFAAISDASRTLSAFTKELHCLYLTDYKVSSLTFLNDGHIIAHLTPPTIEKALKLTLADFKNISKQDCEKARFRFNADKYQLIQKQKNQTSLSQILHVATDSIHQDIGLYPQRFFQHLSSIRQCTHLTLFAAKIEFEVVSELTQKKQINGLSR